MTLTLADATVIATIPGTVATLWLAQRRKRADTRAMERLVAKVTEEASGEYREQAARSDKQHREEVTRIERQHKAELERYDRQLAWLQQRVSGGNNDR